MIELLDLPDVEEFVALVEEYERKYATYDVTYLRAIRDFRNIKLDKLSQFQVLSILNLYLLNGAKCEEF